jgi:CheY-like chemotaxis protein
VLLGLLTNAAQALEARTAARNVVKVRTADDKRSVVIEVSDNGPGIAAEVMPRIFDERFTTKPRGQGTGLGLTIAREIVRAAGGELTAESTPGQGALFRVRLPAAFVGKPTPTPFRAVTTAPPRRARVLIIDDENLLLRACRRMMAKALDVETAEGAEKALELLEKDTRFDVVLCDLMMPHVNGMDLYKIVESRWPQIASHFVFVTGGVYTVAARQFLDQTACPWLEKPVELPQVLAVIDRLRG